MPDHAVITGTYSDLKFIKGRSVVQIVVEAPIEAGEQIVAAFGTPQPGNEIPVAIARLREGSEKGEEAQSECAKEPERKPKSRAQMAGILCNDPVFWAFLNEQCGPFSDGPITTENEAAEAVRGQCMIESRSVLDRDTEAQHLWDQLYSQYQAWKAVGA